MRTVQMELLRPGELLAEQKRISLVYQPVGPVEWHSYHMPLGTDALIAQASARECAKRTGGVVAPTLFIGTERNDEPKMLQNLRVPHDENSYIIGMDFPKNTVPSLYYREEVFAVVVREQLRLLAKMGYRMIVLINVHGAQGQVATLKRLCDETTHELGVYCLYPDFASPRVGEIIRSAKMDPGHADRLETSLMMALTDSVKLQELPPRDQPLHSADFGIASGSQFIGKAPKNGVIRDDPRDASAALGRAVLEADADDSAAFILDAYHKHVENA